MRLELLRARLVPAICQTPLNPKVVLMSLELLMVIDPDKSEGELLRYRLADGNPDNQIARPAPPYSLKWQRMATS